HQKSFKSQAPRRRRRGPNWDLEVGISMVFGSRCLGLGVSPSRPSGFMRWFPVGTDRVIPILDILNGQKFRRNLWEPDDNHPPPLREWGLERVHPRVAGGAGSAGFSPLRRLDGQNTVALGADRGR